jgi:hypothetical protein
MSGVAARICILAAVAAISSSVPSPAVAAPRAQDVLASLQFGDGDQRHILSGDLVTASASESSERELAVVMAFLVKHPPGDLVARFRAAEEVKVDSLVSEYGELRGEGSLEDFKNLRITPATAQRYLDASPGTDLNLDTAEIAAFAALKARHLGGDAVQPVEDQLHSMLLARYRAYRAGGLSASAPYDRGDGNMRQVGEGLLQATEASKVAAQYAPAIQDLLLNYPHGNPTQLEQRFFWINFTIDGQATIVLSHRVAQHLNGGGYVVADRHYYVGRSHNSVQAIGGVLPVDEGSIVFWTNRTSTDQTGGFGSWIKHAIGDRIMAKQMRRTFEKLHALFTNQ